MMGFSLSEIEKSSIALATVYFYIEEEREKGLFLIANLSSKWYQ